MTQQKIPTSLITGFLGVGKTTAILNWLKQCPDNERWAVLVNEFGEVGLDGAILAAESTDNIAIKEVAGGCICCTAGVALQVGLTELIRRVRPDRLLIEATGAGHPAGVIDTLRGEWLQDVLHLHATICLVDPEQFIAHQHHPSKLYQDQLNLADIVVLNKCDRATPDMIQQTVAHVEQLYPPKLSIHQVSQGDIDAVLLHTDPSKVTYHAAYPDLHDHEHKSSHSHHAHTTVSTHTHTKKVAEQDSSQKDDTNTTWQSYINKQVSQQTGGWIFPAEYNFDEDRLMLLFAQTKKEPLTPIIRLKGVFRVDKSKWILFNRSGQHFEMRTINYRRDSRVEFIAGEGLEPDWSAIETALFTTSNTPL